jgi:flavin reductase like protein
VTGRGHTVVCGLIPSPKEIVMNPTSDRPGPRIVGRAPDAGPLLVLVCLNETSRAVDQIEHGGAFDVSVLSAGQQDISRWFANRHRTGVRLERA